jgi:hypothetical protein
MPRRGCGSWQAVGGGDDDALNELASGESGPGLGFECKVVEGESTTNPALRSLLALFCTKAPPDG